MSEVYRKGPIELRLGDYREVLADVAPDAVVTDTPYSERTHAGHDDAIQQTRRAGRYYERKSGGRDTSIQTRRTIDYSSWDATSVRLFLAFWHARTQGWIGSLTSHDLAIAWDEEAQTIGRMGFPLVPCCIRGMTVRMVGDGPSNWAVSWAASRPRTVEYARWGTLPGFYVGPPERGLVVTGGKPLWLMRALVRDYSRPGDLVCDPCAGGATTLIAAALEGRRAIGAELDPDTFAKAGARIERTALTAPLFHDAPPRMRQEGLDLEAG